MVSGLATQIELSNGVSDMRRIACHVTILREILLEITFYFIMKTRSKVEVDLADVLICILYLLIFGYKGSQQLNRLFNFVQKNERDFYG